jgi:soluble cytochrome b562
MSDNEIEIDIEELKVETEQKEESAAEEKVLSSTEKLAVEHGWNPEGEKSAEEFIEFALDNLPERGKQLKRMQRTMDSLIEHNKKQEKIAYDRARQDLEQQRIVAIQHGDVESVRQIEQETQKLHPVQETHAAVVEFQERNSKWLSGSSTEEKAMQAFAFGMDSMLVSEQLSPDDHMTKLQESLNEQFPDYFEIKTKVRSPVAAGTGSNVSKEEHKSKFSVKDLSEQQRKIAEEFEFYKIMTKAEYIADLVKSGELK